MSEFSYIPESLTTPKKKTSGQQNAPFAPKKRSYDHTIFNYSPSSPVPFNCSNEKLYSKFDKSTRAFEIKPKTLNFGDYSPSD